MTPKANRRGAGRKLLIGAGLSLGLLATTDQVLQHVFLDGGQFLGHPVAPFDPPLFAPSQRERLERIERSLRVGDPPPESLRFDADLGWCNPPGGGQGEFRYDWAGARVGIAPLGRDKSTGVRRLALYGCSMTHGDEVGAAQTWAAELDGSRADWEVANMGVSAFGLDQALLRLRRDGPALAADEVWLVWMPQATLRITTLYRPFLRHWSLDVAFKPRLELARDGSVVSVPNPARSLADIPRLLHDQQLLLERLDGHDVWVARAPAAYSPRGSSPLHFSGLARLGLTAFEGTGRDLAQHLSQTHPTRALLEALVTAAGNSAASQGATFRLIVIPGPDDLAQAAAGHAFWRDTCRTLEEAGIALSDLTDDLLGHRDLYAEHGHLNPKGSALAARALVDLLP